MKKISRTEAEQMLVRKGSASLLRTNLEVMAVGEIMLVEKADWGQRKNSPGALCGRIRKQSGKQYVVRVLATGEGWLVERVA